MIMHGTPNPEFIAAWESLRTLIGRHGSHVPRILRLRDVSRSGLYNAKYELTFDENIENMRSGLKQPTTDGQPPLWERDGFATEFETIVKELKRTRPEFHPGPRPKTSYKRRVLENRSAPEGPAAPDFDTVWAKLIAFTKQHGLFLSHDIAITSTHSINKGFMRMVSEEGFDHYIEIIRKNALDRGINPENKIGFQITDQLHTTHQSSPCKIDFTMSLNDILAELKAAHTAWHLKRSSGASI